MSINPSHYFFIRTNHRNSFIRPHNFPHCSELSDSAAVFIRR